MIAKRALSLIITALLIFTLSACTNESEAPAYSENSGEVETQVKKVKKEPYFKFSEKIPHDGLEEKLSVVVTKMIGELTTQGNKFMVSAFPVDSGMLLLDRLSQYFDKRYDDPTIKAEFLAAHAAMRNSYEIYVYLHHIAGYSDDSSIPIDENFYEYFFLENENGDFVRATRQVKNFLTDNVSWVSSEEQVNIYFPIDEVEELMSKGEQLFLTFDGLKITDDNRIEIAYPFSKYYSEEFPELAAMLEEIMD